MIPKVINFSPISITGDKNKSNNSVATNVGIILHLDNNQQIHVEYIKIGPYEFDKLKEDKLKDRTLQVLNEIYNEHNKLTIMGLAHPIYRLSKAYGLNDDYVCCGIESFNDYGNIGRYIIKKFVNIVWLKIKDTARMTELVLTNPINLNSMDDIGNIKITGIENIKAIIDINIDVINYNIKHRTDKTLILNHAEIFCLFNKEIHGIEQIKFNDTCILEDISLSMFTNIKTLKEVQLCKSIKTIEGGVKLRRILRKDNDGYYIDVDELNIKNPVSEKDRIVRITFTQ